MTWENPVFKIELPIEMTNGNDGRGGKWFKSATLRKKYEVMLPHFTPFNFRVNVMVTRFMGPKQREWDSSSWQRGNYKEIEDALVAKGLFADDSPKHIKETRCRQVTSKESGRTTPATMIEVFKVAI